MAAAAGIEVHGYKGSEGGEIQSTGAGTDKARPAHPADARLPGAGVQLAQEPAAARRGRLST